MPQWMSRGSAPLSSSAPKPRRSTAPGARFWTKTSAPWRRRRSTSLAPSSFRFSVRDSFERLSQTKWLARPLTVVSYPRAKSPTPGRSTFMTRAPRSASWRVAKGAATACSRETTVTPSRGRLPFILEGPRETEDVLGDVGKDKVRRDRGDLEEPGFPELALDVVLGIVAVASEGLHRGVRCLPGGLGGQHQGHVCFGPGSLTPLVEVRCPKAHQVRGLHARVCLRYGKLDPLVLPDRAPKDYALFRPLGSPVYKPPSVADALGGDQDPFGVHPVQDVAEALVLLADQGVRRDFQVLEEKLVGLVVYHPPPRLYGEAV